MNNTIEFVLGATAIIAYLVRNWSIENCKRESSEDEKIGFFRYYMASGTKSILVKKEFLLINKKYPNPNKTIANVSTVVFVICFCIFLAIAFSNSYLNN